MLLAASSVMAGKYVFVEKWRTWPAAKLHCRTHFTELPFSFSQDRGEIHKAVQGMTYSLT